MQRNKRFLPIVSEKILRYDLWTDIDLGIKTNIKSMGFHFMGMIYVAQDMTKLRTFASNLKNIP